MNKNAQYGILMGLGVLIGSLGVKAVSSGAARKVAVKGLAAGMRARSGYEGMVEQARVQVDDLVSEASYFNKVKLEEAEADTADQNTEAADDEAKTED